MAANPYINIYKDSITSGIFNVCVSSDESGASPISIGPLNVIASETGTKKLLLKTEPGYKTLVGYNTTILPIGTTSFKWQLAPDVSDAPGVFLAPGSALVVATQINTTGIYFWAKAISINGELVQNDTSVNLQVSYGVQAG